MQRSGVLLSHSYALNGVGGSCWGDGSVGRGQRRVGV